MTKKQMKEELIQNVWHNIPEDCKQAIKELEHLKNKYKTPNYCGDDEFYYAGQI